MDDHLEVTAWSVTDSGLVAMPGPFRRLPGVVRHHQGRGEAWPASVLLAVEGSDLVVADVGRWPLSEVRARRVSDGPPVTFVLEVPGASNLLGAAADPATHRLLAALGT